MNAKIAFVVAVAVAWTTVSAHAFTYDNRTNQNPDGTARFTDPESALGNSADSKSHFSMHFSGGAPGNQSTDDSRFLPSANGAFSSPFSAPNNMDMALANRHW